MNQPDLLSAIRPVVDALERVGASYYIGGSVASSAHGMPRTTLDVDLVANLKSSHVEKLFLGTEGPLKKSPDRSS